MALFAYEEDAFLVELETEITDAGEDAGRPYVVLRDTVLYPEGGGQPGDRGWVNGVAVEDVQRRSGRVLTCLREKLLPGRAHVELDWERRFDHMQQHTAQHLLTAVAADRFGWETTAFHLGRKRSDIELDVAPLSASRLEELEEEVAREIHAARKVSWRMVSPEIYNTLKVRSRGLPAGHEGDIRLVEIDGVDLNTCGGTHVRSTAQLETVKILGTEPMRGGTRVYFIAGRRARALLAAHEKRGAALETLLSVPLSDVETALAAKLEQLHDIHRQHSRFSKEVASFVGRLVAEERASVVAAHFEAGDAAFLRAVASAFCAQKVSSVALLTAGVADNGFFMLVSGDDSSKLATDLGPMVAEILGGRGGGKRGVYQGKGSAVEKRDDALALVRRALGHGG